MTLHNLDGIKDYIKKNLKIEHRQLKMGSTNTTNTVEVILKLDNQEISVTKFSIV